MQLTEYLLFSSSYPNDNCAAQYPDAGFGPPNRPAISVLELPQPRRWPEPRRALPQLYSHRTGGREALPDV